MTEFPVPLDNLIAYVKALRPDGGPLENVADAFALSSQMDEQADALIGYFVDQARRSGLSWSQIGSAMGVSKQAAQKRFVPSRAADLIPEGIKPFSRFTARSARVLAAAGKLAAPDPFGCAHLAAALLSEPNGLAAHVIAKAGVAPERLYSAVGAGPAVRAENTGSLELLDLSFDENAREAVKGALKSALRLGHNYIGTEHLLLGLLSVTGPTAAALAATGLTPERAEQLIAAELTDFLARQTAN
ncbi:MAG TPA: Clp protease N-terminal domain-containing protein [Trebonia sp.]